MAYLDISPGVKIHEMLRASGGNLATLELTIKKQFERKQVNELKGEWMSELILEQKGWDEDMIKTSYQWAVARGWTRKSEVHGRDEWQIPLKETFKFSNTNTESGEATGSTEVQDWLSICLHIFGQEQLPFKQIVLRCFPTSKDPAGVFTNFELSAESAFGHLDENIL